MSELPERVEQGVNARRWLPPGQRILAAISGGADSMVLLHVLQALAPKQRWKISVAHFNHQLRGRASDADERLVRATAKKLSLPFFSERGDVGGLAARSKISVEMAARKLRHEFLARTARAQKISTVALAHHADDQVELFFLRLLRGAGGEGAAGMKGRSPSPADNQVALVRPLLGFSKTEILAFARANKIRFREDATNSSADFLRNRIRNELLPLLRKKYQPGLDQTVLRLMDIVGAEAELAGAAARQWLGKTAAAPAQDPPLGVPALAGPEAACAPGPRLKPGLPTKGRRAGSGVYRAKPGLGHSLRRGRDDFSGLPLAVQRRVVQMQLAGHGVSSDFGLVEQLRGSPGKWVSLGSGLAVARDGEGKIQQLDLGERPENKFNPDELKLKLSGRAGRAEFGGRKFCWHIQRQEGFRRLPQKVAGGPPARRELFDADQIGAEIILRHWRAGDRFQPIGMKVPVKLQDLFVNAKIPAGRRRHLVAATTAAGEIFWVEGLRIGERFKLTNQTRRQWVWNWPA